MKTYKIAVIAGDGVGPEVIAEAVKVLKAAARLDGRFDFTFTDYPWGCEYYLKTGEMMPENGLEILKDYDAILLGALKGCQEGRYRYDLCQRKLRRRVRRKRCLAL